MNTSVSQSLVTKNNERLEIKAFVSEIVSFFIYNIFIELFCREIFVLRTTQLKH